MIEYLAEKTSAAASDSRMAVERRSTRADMSIEGSRISEKKPWKQTQAGDTFYYTRDATAKEARELRDAQLQINELASRAREVQQRDAVVALRLQQQRTLRDNKIASHVASIAQRARSATIQRSINEAERERDSAKTMQRLNAQLEKARLMEQQRAERTRSATGRFPPGISDERRRSFVSSRPQTASVIYEQVSEQLKRSGDLNRRHTQRPCSAVMVRTDANKLWLEASERRRQTTIQQGCRLEQAVLSATQ